MKLLIADDELYMAEYIQKLVDWRDYGFDQVFVANGGSMARDILQEFVPELLITDIKMPRISGLDLSAFIDEKKYPTKVIIISGYSDFGYARQALHYGVSEYLVNLSLRATWWKRWNVSCRRILCWRRKKRRTKSAWPAIKAH